MARRRRESDRAGGETKRAPAGPGYAGGIRGPEKTGVVLQKMKIIRLKRFTVHGSRLKKQGISTVEPLNR
jgi:hypothetical protein